MAITNGYTTLVKVKALMSITSTNATDDGVIEELVTQASRVIDNLTRRQFFASSDTREYDLPVGRTLQMDGDLLTVTTVTNGDGNTIANTEYVLVPQNYPPYYAIKIKQTSAYQWLPSSSGVTEGVISIAGTWGYAATTPADIEKACQDIVIHAYHRREGNNTGGTATITAAGVVITPDSVPGSAMAILRRYMRRF